MSALNALAVTTQIRIVEQELEAKGAHADMSGFVLEFLTIGVMGRAGVGHLSGAREIGHEGPQAMQGAPKRQVNAEEMLAELKRALELSTRAPDAPPSSASTAPKPGSPGPETRPSQIERKGDRPVKANADSSVGQPTDLQKSTRPRSRRWRLTAGGVALAGAAAVCASFALINRAPDLAEREPSVAATESLVRPQTEQTLEPSSSPRAPMQDSPQAAPLQAGALETGPGAGAAPANNGSVSAGGRAEVGAPNLASSGLESTAPAFAPVPPSSPAVWVPSQIIRPDGAPITTAPSTPASTDSAHPAATPKPAVQTAAPQMVKPDKASTCDRAVHSCFDRFSASSGRRRRSLTVQTAAPQMLKPDVARIATAPSTPASTDSAPPLAQTPKPAAPTAAPQVVKPDKASTCNSAADPRLDQFSAASGSDAEAERNADSLCVERIGGAIDAEDRFKEETGLRRRRRKSLLRSPKPPVKPIAQAERRSTEPAPPKEAERSPQPAQGAGNPTALAPVAAPTSVQQRVADGVTHAFGYLMHLPGALVPHLGGSDADAH